MLSESACALLAGDAGMLSESACALLAGDAGMLSESACVLLAVDAGVLSDSACAPLAAAVRAPSGPDRVAPAKPSAAPAALGGAGASLVVRRTPLTPRSGSTTAAVVLAVRPVPDAAELDFQLELVLHAQSSRVVSAAP